MKQDIIIVSLNLQSSAKSPILCPGKTESQVGDISSGPSFNSCIPEYSRDENCTEVSAGAQG